MSFVKNAWFVAGWSKNYGDDLTSATICEQPLVLFRTSTGQVVALEDRCPHKLLPLSKGQRVGDTIQCGYHGMTFDGSGKCVRIPGQDNTPNSAYVDSFPVIEKYGVVWVWLGPPHLANEQDIFELPEFSDQNWHIHHGGAMHVKANYLNVAENLVDPAHVSFVHPTTLGNAASEDVPVHVSTGEEVIVAWRWIRNSPPVGFFQKFGNFKGNVDRWHYYYLHLPSIAVIDFGSIDSTKKCAEEDRGEGVRIFAVHFVTPVAEDYTIDYWMHLRNFEQGNEAVSKQMDEMFEFAFSEDKEVLEAIHCSEQKPQKRKPIRIAIDKAPTTYRKRIRDLIAAESIEELAEPVAPAFIHHD